MLRRLIALTAVSVALLLALAPPASAHVELDPGEAVAGSTETLTFSVAYEGAPTTGLEVKLPEGASVVEVPAKPGWTSSSDPDARTVSWSGGSSAVDETFSIVVELPATSGEVLFPAIQDTTEGEVAWIDEAEDHDHDGHPAPRLTLVAGPNGSTTTTTQARRPGTTLEAQERDDGSTSAAPWLIGSGIAALVAIGVGGTILKRRQA